jgi:hypothetical protein
VISIEEYELIGAMRRYRAGSQTLIHDAGHSYNMIEAAISVKEWSAVRLGPFDCSDGRVRL